MKDVLEFRKPSKRTVTELFAPLTIRNRTSTMWTIRTMCGPVVPWTVHTIDYFRPLEFKVNYPSLDSKGFCCQKGSD